MVRITVRESESLDSAITRFKRKCERAGILRDFKKSSYFIKPSQKKRMRKVKAIRRSLKIQDKV